MRGEKEMFDLILDFARKNNLIKAVLLNGSRANPNAQKDKFMDYDIVYVVDNTQSFIENKDWIKDFGEILIMQEPDNPNLFVSEFSIEEKYTYLIQFKDGNRIDLTFAAIEFSKKICLKEPYTVTLLDKHGIFPKHYAPNDKILHIKKPSEKEFLVCCNEFWWVSTYIAKGLWRNQIIYALEVFNQDVHPEFMKMMRWAIGINNDFKVTVGKYDKYFEKLLPTEIYQKLLETYPSAGFKCIWESFKIMCNLFDESAKEISNVFDFKYNEQESKNVLNYIFKEETLRENG